MSVLRASFQAGFIWIFSCFVVACLYAGVLGGGHGSVIFVFIGFFIGFCGAVAHIFLLLAVRLRNYSKWQQVFRVSVSALLLCLVACVFLYFTKIRVAFFSMSFKDFQIIIAFLFLEILPAAYFACASMVEAKNFSISAIEKKSK